MKSLLMFRMIVLFHLTGENTVVTSFSFKIGRHRSNVHNEFESAISLDQKNP